MKFQKKKSMIRTDELVYNESVTRVKIGCEAGESLITHRFGEASKVACT